MSAVQYGLTFGAGAFFGLFTGRVLSGRGPPFGGRCPKEARERALAEAKAKALADAQAQAAGGDGAVKL
ncbi:uncharacterized protein G2W53_016501 [Senna tora]|uniref:Uncharacterized protein n=1 Tax=Senna tora TaxID=362788 RepID=A0A834WJK5_9FABA|nr:uncharacterized protein G2W53_016501 [Senna tora]